VRAIAGGKRAILLKNSLAVAPFGVVENVDPLERAQIDAVDKVMV
jgi:hypothetical protein